MDASSLVSTEIPGEVGNHYKLFLPTAFLSFLLAFSRTDLALFAALRSSSLIGGGPDLFGGGGPRQVRHGTGFFIFEVIY
jgi:hypothetical protein